MRIYRLGLEYCCDLLVVFGIGLWAIGKQCSWKAASGSGGLGSAKSVRRGQPADGLLRAARLVPVFQVSIRRARQESKKTHNVRIAPSSSANGSSGGTSSSSESSTNSGSIFSAPVLLDAGRACLSRAGYLFVPFVSDGLEGATSDFSPSGEVSVRSMMSSSGFRT